MYSIIVGAGSDAPGYSISIVGGKLVIQKIPGWNPEAFMELKAAVRILGEAVQLKTPGLAEQVAQSVMDFTQRQLSQHVKGDAVLVFT